MPGVRRPLDTNEAAHSRKVVFRLSSQPTPCQYLRSACGPQALRLEFVRHQHVFAIWVQSGDEFPKITHTVGQMLHGASVPCLEIADGPVEFIQERLNFGAGYGRGPY
jgi:hypothetical protein